MDNNYDDFPMGKEPRGYAITGKLFGIVVFMVLLHLYARWYVTRVRHGDRMRRRSRMNRRTHIVFYVDNHIPGSAPVQNRGLDKEVLNSLPVFVYSSDKRDRVSECAVCLSEFEEGETGRVLPKCNHSFHIECIDMWFHTHSTCPLCRSGVEPVTELNRDQSGTRSVETVHVEGEPGSSSGLSSETTSIGSGRKEFDCSTVRIEIPRRTELENEVSLSSPASQSFRSPGSRLLSIKRILSMNKKSPAGPETTNGELFNSSVDLENGLNSPQTQVNKDNSTTFDRHENA
ncbi:hypothetical protein Leryth_017349 [Lithospermum erythrorhizon]|nr:hypothetical protein Leryth_017349 [Lithospermum erythrorhizon]